MSEKKLIYAPLSAGFMLTSMFGFLISIWIIMDWSQSWGFTFTLFFVLMFISSMISMTKAEPLPEHMDALSIHEPEKAYKRVKKEISKDRHYHNIHWYEPAIWFYIFLWVFMVYQSAVGKIQFLNETLLIFFVVSTIAISLFFIIDVLSTDKLSGWQQAFFSLIILVTFGSGAIVYYIYKRLRS